MADYSDLNTAFAALQNPNTPAADLFALTSAQPSLRASIAGHPNAYPGLLDWLAENGDDQVKAAVAARRAAAAPPVPPPPGAPPAPPAAPDWQSQPGFAPPAAPAWQGQYPPPMPIAPPKRKHGKLIGIIAGVVALALIAGGLSFAFFGRKGASSPEGAVSGMMSSLAGGKVSTVSLFQALTNYLPPSELALIDTGSLIAALRDNNSVQRKLMDDIDAIGKNFTVKVSNIQTSSEMIDTGLARVSIKDFTMDVKWDVAGIKTDWRKLITDIIDIGAQLSKTATSDYDALTGNWIGAGFMQMFSYWLTQQFGDGTCQAPPGWSSDSYGLTSDQVLSSQAIDCVANQGTDAVNKSVLDSMSQSGFSFPFTLSGLISDGFLDSGFMSQFAPATGPFVMAVQEGGRWYVSPFMTEAEYGVCSTVSQYARNSYCAPATADLATWAQGVATGDYNVSVLTNLRKTAPATPRTAPTPGAAVQATLDAFGAMPNNGDYQIGQAWYQAESALAATMPTAERRLYGTYPSMLQSLAYVDSAYKHFTGQFSVASTNNGRAIVRIDSLSAAGDSTWRVYDGSCLSYDDGWTSFDGCLSKVFDASTYYNQDVYFDTALFARAVLAFQQKAPLDQVGLVALQEKGGWQFSPTASSWHLATWLWSGSFAALNAIMTG